MSIKTNSLNMRWWDKISQVKADSYQTLGFVYFQGTFLVWDLLGGIGGSVCLFVVSLSFGFDFMCEVENLPMP